MKVAVVTGGNKGIGLAIVERLARELPDWAVYLTARNPELGQTSVKQLAAKGVKTNFHQLDITSEQSIEKFAKYVKEKYGGLDILINNAAIAYKESSTDPFGEQAEVSMKTNFFGTLNVCNRLFPLLRPHARVVNLSSMAAPMTLAKVSPGLGKKFTSPTSMADLVSTMNQFVSDAKRGVHVQSGFANWSYGTTKLGVTVMSIIQQNEFDRDSREDIIVNASCPGFVATDMTSHKGQMTVEEGADTPCYLATLPKNAASPRGKHVSFRKIVEWK